MAFDPDAYLAGSSTAVAPFNPDKYLRKKPDDQQAGEDYLRRIESLKGQPPESLPPSEMARTGMTQVEPGEVTGGKELSPEAARLVAFAQGAGVPSSVDEIKDFLLRSPVQDVKDIYGDVTQMPERLQNIRQTLSESPAATVYRDPLSLEAFGVYGTTAAMSSGLLEKIRAKLIAESPDAAVLTPKPQTNDSTGNVATPRPIPEPQDVQANIPEPGAIPKDKLYGIHNLAQLYVQRGLSPEEAMQRAVAEIAPAENTVRLYHGGAGEQAGSDFTTNKQYAEDYAAKSGGKLWYVDVPEGLLKTHDEYGQPMTRVVVPDEIANEAKSLTVKPDEFRPQDEPRPTDQAVGEPSRQPAPDTESPAGVADQTAPEVGRKAGTSNRINTEIYGKDAVPSGQGVDAGELLDQARADIRTGKADPYGILSRTRQRGIALPDEYAALAAEHERLVNEAVAKEKANDPAAPEAAKHAEDFANAIQPHKTAASDLMRLFQGDINYDMGTEFGMAQYMKAELGRAPQGAEIPKLRQRSRQISGAQVEARTAVERADVKVRRGYAKVRDIPMDEAANRVREWLKDCQV